MPVAIHLLAGELGKRRPKSGPRWNRTAEFGTQETLTHGGTCRVTESSQWMCVTTALPQTIVLLHRNRLPGERAKINLLCPCDVFPMECWEDPSAGSTVSAASSSLMAIRRHRRSDCLLRAMDDPFDLLADAMLKDTENLQLVSAVAAHLQALRHWRKRVRGSWVHRWPRFVGSVPGRRPNKRRNCRSGLHAILANYVVSNEEPPVYNEGDFERRFRVPSRLVLRIYNAVKDRSFFAQRINATG